VFGGGTTVPGTTGPTPNGMTGDVVAVAAGSSGKGTAVWNALPFSTTLPPERCQNRQFEVFDRATSYGPRKRVRPRHLAVRT
jgi:hypothetical protein